ncbi:terpenoid synthase [Phlegmacium glaucopus]|nr:terpenoid synthase [Phlegmacium glaucopus]
MHQRCIRLHDLRCSIHGIPRRRGHVSTHIHTVVASKPRPDPFSTVSPPLTSLRTNLLTMLGSGHPAITEIAKYYFSLPSKQIRPVIVLLISQATNGLGADWSRKLWESQCHGAGGRAEELNQPLTRPDVLNDWNPEMPDDTRAFDPIFNLNPGVSHRLPVPTLPPNLAASTSENATYLTTSTLSPSPLQSPPLNLANTVLPTQLRFAQIVELLHSASLLHDDVVDGSALRRGAPSAPVAFGNKLSVLGGSFVLGRTSVALARLGDQEVSELTASIYSDIVEGEIMQTKEIRTDGNGKEIVNENVHDESPTQKTSTAGKTSSREALNIYLRKTYLKTASLMAKGARCAVVLGGCKEGEIWKEIAYAYGRNLGMAFQLIDDVLDYESASAALGKPGGADLGLGLATGPALYAWEEYPEMGILIQRMFKEPGDVEKARDLVLRSSGVQRTRMLAQEHADKAKQVLQDLPESEARIALEVLTERVIGRKF